MYCKGNKRSSEKAVINSEAKNILKKGGDFSALSVLNEMFSQSYDFPCEQVMENIL